MSITIKTEEEFLSLKKNNHMMIVDFYGDYCQPCKKTAPIFEEAAAEFPDVVFAKINTDHKPTENVVISMKLRGVPTFAIFIDNQYINKHVGGMSKDQMYAFINDYRR
jgi:thiol-disulfide isomerase/thioredoxin